MTIDEDRVSSVLAERRITTAYGVRDPNPEAEAWRRGFQRAMMLAAQQLGLCVLGRGTTVDDEQHEYHRRDDIVDNARQLALAVFRDRVEHEDGVIHSDTAHARGAACDLCDALLELQKLGLF